MKDPNSPVFEQLPLQLAPGEATEFIQTGSKCIDFVCGGIPKNRVTVVTGGSGQGKSMLLANMAYLTAVNNPNVNVAYISLENERADDSDRFNTIIADYGKCANFDYANLSDQAFNAETETDAWEMLKVVLENTSYDLYFIDGTEMVFSQDPQQMHLNGNECMKEYIKMTKAGKTIIFSWQLKKESVGKKLKELSQFDISASSCICQKAGVVLAIGSNDNMNKSIRILKCRYRRATDSEEENLIYNSMTGNQYKLIANKTIRRDS